MQIDRSLINWLHCAFQIQSICFITCERKLSTSCSLINFTGKILTNWISSRSELAPAQAYYCIHIWDESSCCPWLWKCRSSNLVHHIIWLRFCNLYFCVGIYRSRFVVFLKFLFVYRTCISSFHLKITCAISFK